MSLGLLSTFGPGATGWQDYATLEESVTGLNSILTSIGVAIGGIIIVFAVFKLITSFTDQNAMSKMQASMLFGIGAFFMMISKVVEALDISGSLDSTNGLSTMVTNIFEDVLSPVIYWIGLVFLVISVFLLIMSIAHESPEEQIKAQTGLGIGIGCIGSNSIIRVINHLVNKALSSGLETSVADYAIAIAGSCITSVAFYIGLFFVATGIFRLILSIRTEDSKEREHAIRFLVIAIALISFSAVLTLFGLGNAAFYTKNGWVWGLGNLS